MDRIHYCIFTVIPKPVLFGAIFILVPIFCKAQTGYQHRSTIEAVEQAHSSLGKFIDPYGIVLDYNGEIPTPEDCILGRPNAIGWWTPIENGPMYTGMYLAAMCVRAMRTGEHVDKVLARRLAQGLLLLGSVSDVPGVIARGVGTDGKCHYAFGSDDQTGPWFYGLYIYWKSKLPTEAEKKTIVKIVKKVADARQALAWRNPCDGALKGSFDGDLKEPIFRDSVRLLFIFRAVYEMTGDAVWAERYKIACNENTIKNLTRMQICERGIAFDMEWYKWSRDKTWPFWTWIYVEAQATLKMLAEMEQDPERRARFHAGLKANASDALLDVQGYKNFDNLDTKVFGEKNWRAVYPYWLPQKTRAEALKLSQQRDRQAGGERCDYEKRLVGAPLAAAAIVAFGGDTAHQELVEKAIRHYNFDAMYISRFLYSEIAYYALPSTACQK